ncbi:hypothetical protein ACFXHA_26975 [Nocardia sp. NPDC059240]|uniref:hypothetical protein n=1 Tax=Nocardia sp. NPDC059240 TaxID=3346786 RepID=UPI00367F4468
MTNSTVLIQRYPDGLCAITAAGTPDVLTAAPGPDTMVLQVLGGHLVWNVLAGQEIPAALLDDTDSAQEWVWAIYGEPAALALDAVATGGESAEATAFAARPALAASAYRLAYAHWASRWWPASTLDGIAALDQDLLDLDIAQLTEECEALLDGADALAPPVSATAESSLRASDYALAAGDEHRSGALVLARGTDGWDWRRCPPGLVDASESAVSWELVRDAGATTVAISVAAHPERSADAPAHLRPWARVDTGRGEVDTELRPVHDTWIGESPLSAPASAIRIAIHVPGFGPLPDTASPLESAADLRARIRDFAAARLHSAAIPEIDGDPLAPLLAEIAAAAGDSDF